MSPAEALATIAALRRGVVALREEATTVAAALGMADLSLAADDDEIGTVALVEEAVRAGARFREVAERLPAAERVEAAVGVLVALVPAP